ncbi:MAG: extracellular solute-binding protein [Actinomycetaceae bacterium]|nr:extracellular solute-binding protein [Actinomycetaceae bacterium]
MTVTRREALILGTTVLGASFGLAACTGGTGSSGEQKPIDTDGKLSGTVKFQTWSLKNERFTAYFENLISEFEKANPDVTIEWIDQPGDGYEEKILQQANSGTLPDVINIPPEFAMTLAQSGLLVDIAQAHPEIIDVYVPGGIKGYTYEDPAGSFGFPWYLGTTVNFWNTKLLEEGGVDTSHLPMSDQEYEAAALTMVENGASAKLVDSMPTFQTFVNAGVELYKDGEFVFNTPEAAAVVDRYAELYAKGAMVPEALTGSGEAKAPLFPSQKTAYTSGTGSTAIQLREDAPTIYENLAVTKSWGTPPLLLQGISVSANASAPEAAMAFAEFVTNNENQVEFVKIAKGFMPGTKEGNANPESFLSDIEDPFEKKTMELAAESMATAENIRPILFTQTLETYFNQQMALAVKGDISGQEALDRIVQHCNDSIK